MCNLLHQFTEIKENIETQIYTAMFIYWVFGQKLQYWQFFCDK